MRDFILKRFAFFLEADYASVATSAYEEEIGTIGLRIVAGLYAFVTCGFAGLPVTVF